MPFASKINKFSCDNVEVTDSETICEIISEDMIFKCKIQDKVRTYFISGQENEYKVVHNYCKITTSLIERYIV